MHLALSPSDSDSTAATSALLFLSHNAKALPDFKSPINPERWVLDSIRAAWELLKKLTLVSSQLMGTQGGGDTNSENTIRHVSF
jgi:hypothetical protein